LQNHKKTLNEQAFHECTSIDISSCNATEPLFYTTTTKKLKDKQIIKCNYVTVAIIRRRVGCKN
jgi:hypothetical protein